MVKYTIWREETEFIERVFFPASLAPEFQPPTWCREWQWRGEKGE